MKILNFGSLNIDKVYTQKRSGDDVQQEKLRNN